jgi:hypothetical protein
MEKDFSRRERLDLMRPIELKIYKVMEEVKRMPADMRLTEAAILLDKARNLVSDFIDERLIEEIEAARQLYVDTAMKIASEE